MRPEAELRALTESFLSRAGTGLSGVSREEIQALREVVRWHNDLYYRHEKPEISDAEYDRLFKFLESAERNFRDFDPSSPTARIDVALSNQFKKGLHASPMISLDNTYNEEELTDFDQRLKRAAGIPESADVPYDAELKFDGLGLSLAYRDGRLVRALTRGNGIEGEDVTANALQISSIPHSVPFPGELEIRGEVVMPESAFLALNRERAAAGEKLFANPRNAASGSLRQLDVSVTKSRNLRFYAYSVPAFEGAEWRSRVPTYARCLALLRENGFTTTPYFRELFGIRSVISEIRSFGGKKPEFEFDIDGLVIKADSFSTWSAAGYTEHHPRHSVAYKFPATQVRTKLLSVEHSVGRTGAVTPVANLEPVNVGGVMVRRATLHNYDEAAAKDVRVGDTVFLRRAGEVIPEIVGPVPEARNGSETPVLAPYACPACGAALVREGDDVVWRCPNREECPAQAARSLEWFVGKNAMDIDGLGKKQIVRFRELGWVRDLPSLYRLDRLRAEILALDGYQEKSVDNLLAAIEASRRAPVPRLLAALGIPGVGKKTGKTLARFFRSKADFTDFKPSPEELQDAKDVGPETANAVAEFFRDNAPMLRELMDELDPDFSAAAPEVAREGTGAAAGPLAGKTFCVTGSFAGYSRDQLVEMGEKAGGEFRDSVSKKLSLLVVGADAGLKLPKAQTLGVRTVGLEEYLKEVSVAG